jgi:ubiquinone/menaquinone biosynthesis C-methylase UbiE
MLSKQIAVELPPAWSIKRPKDVMQSSYDLVGAPLRMALLPDHTCERLHLTSLRAERFAAVLCELRGRVLDVGAGDNALLKLYRAHARGPSEVSAAAASVGVDVIDWGADCVIVPNCRSLPFTDASFDTVSFVACLNHIPERREALAEARRILKPGGRVVVTMISRFVGVLGHAIWWYSEDKRRQVAAGEEMGLDSEEVVALLTSSRFKNVTTRRFLYKLNGLHTAIR